MVHKTIEFKGRTVTAVLTHDPTYYEVHNAYGIGLAIRNPEDDMDPALAKTIAEGRAAKALTAFQSKKAIDTRSLYLWYIIEVGDLFSEKGFQRSFLNAWLKSKEGRGILEFKFKELGLL